MEGAPTDREWRILNKANAEVQEELENLKRQGCVCETNVSGGYMTHNIGPQMPFLSVTPKAGCPVPEHKERLAERERAAAQAEREKAAQERARQEHEQEQARRQAANDAVKNVFRRTFASLVTLVIVPVIVILSIVSIAVIREGIVGEALVAVIAGSAMALVSLGMVVWLVRFLKNSFS